MESKVVAQIWLAFLNSHLLSTNALDYKTSYSRSVLNFVFFVVVFVVVVFVNPYSDAQWNRRCVSAGILPGKKSRWRHEKKEMHQRSSIIPFCPFFFDLPHFPSDSVSPDERSESSRQLAAPLLKGYTVKLSAINTTKLQALYKMPISVLERMAIDCCREELIWMLLHFVSVSGFMEAGRTVDIMADEGGWKNKHTHTDQIMDHLFDQHRLQCLCYSQIFEWKNLHPHKIGTLEINLFWHSQRHCFSTHANSEGQYGQKRFCCIFLFFYYFF